VSRAALLGHHEEIVAGAFQALDAPPATDAPRGSPPIGSPELLNTLAKRVSVVIDLSERLKPPLEANQPHKTLRHAAAQ
jgi:hypothetical protein